MKIEKKLALGCTSLFQRSEQRRKSAKAPSALRDGLKRVCLRRTLRGVFASNLIMSQGVGYTFRVNRQRALDYLNTQERLYCFDGFAGYEATAKKPAGLFNKNFETYAASVSAEVKASAPKA